MTGVVDEAEEVYSSRTPGLILLVLFQESLCISFFCSYFALILLTLSLDYDSVDMLVFSLLFTIHRRGCVFSHSLKNVRDNDVIYTK